MDELLNIGAAFDWFSPVVKTLRGFNIVVATGGAALTGHDKLKQARIPCALDTSPYMDDYYLSVRGEDEARAIEVLNADTQKSG